jgi:peroxiredoxin
MPNAGQGMFFRATRRLGRWFPLFALGTLFLLLIGGRFYSSRATSDHPDAHRATVSSEAKGIRVGETVPDFALVDLDNKVRRLSGYAGKTVVIVTVGLKCPCVESYRGRLNDLAAAYAARGVVFIGFNPNANETHEQVLANRTARPFNFPIGCDNQQAIADLLGATHMTEVFLIDGNGILRYRGRIDDNTYHPQSVTRRDLKDALDAVLSGRSVPVKSEPAIGCVIVRDPAGES